MMCVRPRNRQRGAVMPFVILCCVALFAFAALAIDFGIMAVARTQAQNAADTAAMAGARSLTGDTTTNNNYENAGPAAATAGTAHSILSKPLSPSQINVEVGSYTYEVASAKFEVMIPKATNDNYSLVRARVDAQSGFGFGRALGFQTFNTSATATAVHRPRDVAIILDFSGSMRFDSLLGISYYGDRTRSNNAESVFPRFGGYSDTSAAALQNTNDVTVLGGEVYGSSNVTQANSSGPAIVDAFYQHSQGSTSTQRAFSPAPDSYETTPGGDNYLRTSNNSGSSYAKTVQDILGTTSYNATWEQDGYSTYGTFHGYSVGPRYWGKTFFIWPPDPRAEHDWRKKFFFKSNGTTPVDDNLLLWEGSGDDWRPPRSGNTTYYKINYQAILNWLFNTGPNPFPPRLRAGRILYYDALPDATDSGLNNRFWTQFPLSDLNERFWKEYIDHVLGVKQTGSTSWTQVVRQTGYGNDFLWGGSGQARMTARSASSSESPRRYMDYRDNPLRPKLHFWFGPMTMVDFLGNYNQDRYWWPGTCHEAPLNASKLGVQAALQDMQINHPNDFVSIMMFSTPKYSANGSGRFNRVRGPLGRNYQRMIDALWFPPYTIDNPGTEIRPYDSSDNLEGPRGMGGTCPAMGFMLAYNQFSSNSSLRNYAPAPSPEGEAGGLGRRGAQKLIIFQTDGMANTAAAANFQNQGPYNSYYQIRQPGEYPSNSGTVTTQLYGIVDKICAKDDASSPGYSTNRKPVLIHCLAFGTLFEPTTTDSDKALALDLLQNIQYKGKTQATATTPLADYKKIIGTSTQRIDKLRQAFSAIMQDGVQVSLIE